MKELAGYLVTEQIYEGDRTVVYRGVDPQNSGSVILKKLRQEYPTFNELLQFSHQYVITKNLDLPGIVKPLALKKEANSYVLVMEDVGGISLSQYYRERSASSEEFFPISIALCKILAELYRHRIIHKDIKPSNVLINPETLEIYLIDFSISSLLPKETQTLQSVGQLEGTLAYISPEQTGRTNRGIDYRSDFYSLGVTFYQLLAGQLPFNSNDAMELVHCHIAKMPAALGKIGKRQEVILGKRQEAILGKRQEARGNRQEARGKRQEARGNRQEVILGKRQEAIGNRGEVGEIPGVLSDIVFKLMAKAPEERYQSALGLKYDLEKCWQQWQETGEIKYFELGQKDYSDRFIIPEKLYGRETEVKTLLDAFDSATAGNTEMMLVAGFSGIGKTAVVSEIHKPIVEKRGYFIEGKFDQFNRNIPLSAFVMALRDLMGQLLGESDAAIAKWKSQILSALGEQGKVIIDIIPELETIIGEQPEVSELSASAAQNRFNLLFRKFIQVFSAKEHPLVIFLDDLQWADSASLKLLKLLASEWEEGYLLILGAYRDNEVYRAHPLMLTLEEIGKTSATIKTITLTPLPQSEINRLVADTLNCGLELAKPLTELVYQKTKGNPFFSDRFLKSLHEDGWIEFNFELGYWQYDIAKVRELSLTDDVVEFMAARLKKLPFATREILQLAACIGNQFDLGTLAIVSEQSLEEAATSLWGALQQGLIFPLSETYKFYQTADSPFPGETKIYPPPNSQFPKYKFLHDRVQQAAYSLIPEAQKQNTHFQIGKLLLTKVPPEEKEERIFELVNQLNYGTSIITERGKRDELAQLNLIACRKARAATAYTAGREYAEVALSLLGENAWERQYELTLALHELAAELASLCGDFEGMEELVETVLQRSRNLLDTVNIYRIRILSKVSQNKATEAINIAKKFLQQLGVVLSDPPAEEDIQNSIAEVYKAIADREIEDLAFLKPMSDRQQIAIVEIANSIAPAAYISGSPLFPLLVALCVKLSIQYGNISVSVSAYAVFGIIASNMLQDVETGVKFGQLALRLVSQLDAETVKHEVLHVVAIFILHRKFQIKEALPLSQEGYLAAMKVGNLEYLGYNAHSYSLNAFWSSVSLTSLESETRAYCQALAQFNQVTTANWCRIYWQSILNLLGASEDNILLSGKALREETFLPPLLEARDLTGLFLFYLYKLMLCYLFGDFEAAESNAAEVRRYLMGGLGVVGEPAFYFYDSLSALGGPNLSDEEKSQILQRVEENQTELQQQWANHAPMNYQHKVDLVAAEKARVLGLMAEAIELYDKAISGAKENEFVSEEALANELAAKFYLNWGKEKVAAGYMQSAYYCYSRWGAKAKIEDLEKRYRQLLAPILHREKPSLATNVTISSITEGTLSSSSSSTNMLLDFASAFKASLAIAGEIELEGLLWKLMEVVMENAGATKSALLLPKEDSLVIEAMATYSEEGVLETISLHDSLPLESNSELSQTIVNTVKRTREVVVINDLSKQGRLAADRYLLRCQPQSILCLPLIARGRLRGILYLENQVTSGAFASDRLEILKVIAAQAAISLQNARLYQDVETAKQKLEFYNQTLEQKVAARTEELNDKNEHLVATLAELRQTQAQLIQTEKMSSLGRMVGGIAHEINNPTAFIFGNLHCAQDYLQDLLDLIEVYREDFPEGSDRVADKLEEIELDYLTEDLEKLFASMKNGCDRIRTIVLSLRTFSRLDEAQQKQIDIHASIDSTILLLQNRLRDAFPHSIEIVKKYGNLPPITCYASQLNQVFFHILSNAIDAFSSVSNSLKPIIAIRTKVVDKLTVEITISDNGSGMERDTLAKMFDPFFTTKPIGKGTGLGMAIAYQIIVAEHGGNLTCESELGKGTDAVITLPVTPLPKK